MDLNDANVAVVGYGVEGQAAARYAETHGATVTICDTNTNLNTGVYVAQLGDDYLSDIDKFDVVFRSPSVRPDLLESAKRVVSNTSVFFALFDGAIIGVTGTKGKGTTSTLISKILDEAGLKTWLVGNIGKPALDVLPQIQSEDIVVYELSSFQLWDLEKSPETAVVLTIEADHMDVHSSMAEYIDAKANIGKHQTPTDMIIYHQTNQYAQQIADQSLAQKKRYQTPDGAHVVDNQIIINNQPICQTSEVGLIGKHNLENICAAITAAWGYTQDAAAIKRAVTSFKGLPHRLEFVREVAGVRYFDDSFSSALSSTVAAIRSFTQPEIVILGGFDRGLDLYELAVAVQQQSNIKKIILIGQTAGKLQQALASAGVDQASLINNQPQSMAEIVQIVQQNAISGDVVLLSPGAPSFDMFDNFRQRGELFQEAINGL